MDSVSNARDSTDMPVTRFRTREFFEESSKQHPWRVLVVDDEPDIFQVTTLALKHRTWRGRGFEFVYEKSGRDAAARIRKEGHLFHVALVDVVMETDSAGLLLCERLRAECPKSLRILLRTGQPGVAPEETVMNDFDIDGYIAKSEATPERLYGAVRACLRGYLDLATVHAFGKELRDFLVSGRVATTEDDLFEVVAEALRFVEDKHGVRLTFVHDTSDPRPVRGRAALWDTPAMRPFRGEQIAELVRGFTQADPSAWERVHRLPVEALGEGACLFPFQYWLGEQDEPTRKRVEAGVVVEFRPEMLGDRWMEDVAMDLRVLVSHFAMAERTYVLREWVARERVLREEMTRERLRSARSRAEAFFSKVEASLSKANEDAQKMQGSDPQSWAKQALAPSERVLTVLAELRAEAERLGDAPVFARDAREVPLGAFVRQTLAAFAELRLTVRGDATVVVNPSHLEQLLVFVGDNIAVHAYEGGAGDVSVEIENLPHEGRDGVRITLSDRGVGLSPHVARRVMDPFVTSKPKTRRGLGLAMAASLATMLRASLECAPREGGGVAISLWLPKGKRAPSP